MITWRHFGKPEIVAIINNQILCASLQIRQLLSGRTAQGDRSKNNQNNRAPSPATRAPHVIQDMGEVGGAAGGQTVT